MRRIISLLLAVLVCAGVVSGCTTEQKTDERLSVVCTIFPQYDIVRQIAGDNVKLTMLLPYGMESHDFKLENLSVKDLQTVSEADVFISVGGESDSGWVADLKARVGNKSTVWVELCDLTETLCAEEHEHNGHNHHHDDEAIDEHVWTSPKRMLEISPKIAEILKSADPSIANECNQGLANFSQDLSVLDNELESLVCNKPLIFADRFSFRYLFYDYGLEYEAAFAGCSSSVDPSALQIAGLTKKAVDSGTKVIFYMENSNTRYAKKIAEQSGSVIRLLHSCHNVSSREFNGGANYISLMTSNLQALKEAVE